MRRSRFLQSLSAAGAAVLLNGCRPQAAVAQQAARPRRILLRSSWQVVNIGDIAHTPGVLSLLEQHLPDAEVILWASTDLTDEVAAMEHRRFPKLRIVKGSIWRNCRATSPELAEAIEWAEFLLHGSGPSLVAESDVAAFVKHTGKPFGVFGITWSGGSSDTIALLSQARFLFFRDSVSLATARAKGVTAPIMDFGPDGAFACDLRNEVAASEFLEAHQLSDHGFLCCIPRLRYTPYWLIKKGRAFDKLRHERNEQMKEHDHAPLRQAIEAVVRQTDLKVLICPEDMTQMAVGRENLFDKLAADVKDRVVWRDSFWLTDQALSVYVRSAGMFGLEMHSPIMCIGNRIPAIVCRFEEQTSKGFMWRDIGLGDWLFNMDVAAEVHGVLPAVLDMAQHPETARARVIKAQELVRAKHHQMVAALAGQ